MGTEPLYNVCENMRLFQRQPKQKDETEEEKESLEKSRVIYVNLFHSRQIRTI